MEAPQAGIDAIGRNTRAALDAEGRGPEDIRQARRALLERVTLPHHGGIVRSSRYWTLRGVGALTPSWMVGGSVGLLAGAAALWLWLQIPISFEAGTGGPAIKVGDRVKAGEQLPITLNFSEGSAVRLEPGGQMRVLSTDAAGARVLLESGTAHAKIEHRRWGETRWDFEAGPFLIRVIGTEFSTSWNPETRALSVITTAGSVQVSGGCLSGRKAVGVDAALRVACPLAVASPAPTPSFSVAEPAASGGAPSRVRLGAETTDAAGVRSAPPEVSAAALRPAERSGNEGAVLPATPQELLAAADAARLSGNAGRSAEMLRRLRQRFPRSPEAATAAFLLGRIASDQQRAFGEAVRWFSTYLDEAPQGPLMGDATGRLMQARQKQGDLGGARSDAARYLRRFPKGPYASQAHGILSE